MFPSDDNVHKVLTQCLNTHEILAHYLNSLRAVILISFLGWPNFCSCDHQPPEQCKLTAASHRCSGRRWTTDWSGVTHRANWSWMMAWRNVATFGITVMPMIFKHNCQCQRRLYHLEKFTDSTYARSLSEPVQDKFDHMVSRKSLPPTLNWPLRFIVFLIEMKLYFPGIAWYH